MNNTMSLEEITILGATDVEFFAYIKPSSVDKEWPVEIVHNNISFLYEGHWLLPTKMREGYIKVARYIVLTP
jgi:hypothetical protein